MNKIFCKVLLVSYTPVLKAKKDDHLNFAEISSDSYAKKVHYKCTRIPLAYD